MNVKVNDLRRQRYFRLVGMRSVLTKGRLVQRLTDADQGRSILQILQRRSLLTHRLSQVVKYTPDKSGQWAE